MSTRSQNIKNFIKDVGTRNQLFVFAGQDDASTVSDASKTQIDIWRNSNFGVKVGQNSLIPVVPNKKWTEKKPYKPWSSNSQNNGNYYVYNEENNYVYLCISDNEKNRKDYQGNNVSNIRPSHTTGTQTYSDGYVWKVLYKITPSLEKFVTSTWIPVVSFDTFDSTPQTSLNSQANSFCGGDTSISGNCSFYAKKGIVNASDSSECSANSLNFSINQIKCSICYDLSIDNERYYVVFSEDTPSSTYPGIDKYTEVENNININEISPSSPYYYLYDINANDNLSEGSVVSCSLDLSSFTQSQLQLSVSNPEFIITSGSGNGARIQLTTIITNSDSIVIDGIKIIDPGSGYKDIILDLDENIFIDTSVKDLLLAVVEVNLDKIDGLGFDPVEALNSEHVMIDVRLEKTDLSSEKIELPEYFNFFGLISNPEETTISGTQIVSGSTQNKKLNTFYRTSVKATLSKVSTNPLPSRGDTVTLEYTKNNSTNTISNVKIIGLESLTSSSENVELGNIDYSTSDELVGGKVYTSSTQYSTITSIDAKPNFVQYTGKILSTSKTDNLSVEDPETVIIRINMVKGM